MNDEAQRCPSLFSYLQTRVAPKDIDDLLFEGMYPPVRAKGLDPSPWFANYVMTYVERGEDLHAYEIKSGKTVSADYFRRLKRFSAIASGARVRPEVIYAGEEESTRDGCSRPLRLVGNQPFGG